MLIKGGLFALMLVLILGSLMGEVKERVFNDPPGSCGAYGCALIIKLLVGGRRGHAINHGRKIRESTGQRIKLSPDQLDFLASDWVGILNGIRLLLRSWDITWSYSECRSHNRDRRRGRWVLRLKATSI